MKFAQTPPMQLRDWVAVSIAATRCGVHISDIFAAIDKRKLRRTRVTIGAQTCEYVLLHQCREFFKKPIR